jgi:hypothetical protein
MIQRVDNWDAVEAFTGDFETVTPGGHVCKILRVVAEDKDYGQLLRIGFDIIEGQHADFYKRKFDNNTNAEKKWPGMYYQTIKKEDLKFFKGFITSVEKSNEGWKWNWNEQELVGKKFLGVFGEEEYEANDGTIKTVVKCRNIRSVDQKDKIIVPEPKRINKPTAFVPAGIQVVNDDLPF